MTTTPCSWPIDRTCLPPLPALSGSPTTDEQAAYDAAVARQFDAEDMAVTVLWGLTGRQFGICQTTIRPCADRHDPIDLFAMYSQFTGGFRHTIGGLRSYLGCGCGDQRCRQGGPTACHLPGPVQVGQNYPMTVEFGLGDGTTRVLDPSEFTVEGDVLFRFKREWPTQDLSRPLGERGTWAVTYWRGNPVPRSAGRFVGVLAKELLLAACNDAKCRLPKGVNRVNRQGVSWDLDPNAMFANGKTGLPEVDQWLASLNPHHLMEAPSVL